MSSIFVQIDRKIYRPGIFQLFPAIQASVKYKPTFLCTMAENSTFCTNQGLNFRYCHFHQKSGRAFVQFDETPFPRPGFFLLPPYNGCEKYSIYI